MLDLVLDRKPGSSLKLLCIGAHSDDLEIGCGGTLLRLSKETPKLEVYWLVLSAHGQREKEARKGASLFLKNTTKTEIDIQKFRDGYFPYEGSAIKDYFEQLKKVLHPDLILTHCSDDAHQDHRLVNQLTWNTWRNHLILEYEIPKYDGDLGRPNLFVPLTAALARAKAKKLLSAFDSQRTRHWFTEDLILGLMRIRGVEACSSSGFAEAFYARKIRL